MKNGLIIWSIWALTGTGILYAYEVVKAKEIIEAEDQDHSQMYCAKMKDGKMVVMHEDKPITADVFLKNGTTIKPDGTIITREGERTTLKEGECIDAEGKINQDKIGEPYQKEE